MALIAPSVLSADFLQLERDIEMLNRSEADWLHLDGRTICSEYQFWLTCDQRYQTCSQEDHGCASDDRRAGPLRS